MKSVYLIKPFKRLLSVVCKNTTCRLGAPAQHHKALAFSLVEMLMALLVASLILAALAPVMTKKFGDTNINVAGALTASGNSGVEIFTEDGTFEVPTDVVRLKVTMIGGGGAGGNAKFGSESKTTSGEWTVPEGVTKIRYFMIGGGGGGASGNSGAGGTKISYTGYKEFSNAKEYTFNTSTAVVPDIDPLCADSGVTKWTSNEDNSTLYTPGQTFTTFKVTACGGGGGGGGYGAGYARAGGGGSGGYIADKTINLSANTTYYIKVGGGGGGGGSFSSGGANGGYGAGGGGQGSSTDIPSSGPGTGGTYGGKGGTVGIGTSSGSGVAGTGTALSAAGSGGMGGQRAGSGGRGSLWGGGGGGGAYAPANPGSSPGGGGGGGGPTTISTASGTSGTIVFQIGGGGGGGGGIGKSTTLSGGGGGGGGGYGAGGGGGGRGGSSGGSAGSGSSYQSALIGCGSGSAGKAGSSGSSGGGGGGYGGVSGNNGYNEYATDDTEGRGGIVSTIWGTYACKGGNASYNGSDGRLKLYWHPKLKCTYSAAGNGGGGGGAGQISIGELDVTPGETLYFEVGNGGAVQSTKGTNGNAGSPTYIRRGGSDGTIIATALGGNPGQYNSTIPAVSAGGALKAPNLTNNWTGISFTGGNAGGASTLSTDSSNPNYGGKGGSIQNMEGTILPGGAGGNTSKNGSSPSATSYGAGGGGGSGALKGETTFGTGGAGASGYIYVEYGGSSGGGGTAGEFVTKTIVPRTSTIDVSIGKGGSPETGDGNGGNTKFGDDSAKGGLRGYDGGMDKGAHGAERELPSGYVNKSLSETAGQAGTDTYGGIGGYMKYLYNNNNNAITTAVSSKNGTIAGPVTPGCGGVLTFAASSNIYGTTCNEAGSINSGAAYGKDGMFGAGGGGGSVYNGVAGNGGKGGDGIVIIQYEHQTE